MNTDPRRCALAMLLVLCLGLIAPAQDEEEPTPVPESEPEMVKDNETLPKLADMKIPEADELMSSKPVDWVVMLNEDVLVVEPVSPRPGTLEKMSEEIKRLGNVKGKTTDEIEAIRIRRRELLRLQVTLLEEGEDPDYTVETKLIRTIIHHEDQVLSRVGMCLEQNQTAQAFELLVYLDLRHPGWPGYDRVANSLLLKEAELRQQQPDGEAAWRFAEELYARDPAFPGLANVAGEIIDALIRSAIEDLDYRQARHFLRRLSQRDAAHPVAERWRTELSNQAAAQIGLARTASAAGDAARASELIDQAARIWPEAAGLKEAHKELTNRYQILRVGVLDLPTELSNYPFPTRAQVRWESLQTLRWFDVNRFGSTGPRYRSIPCESWEPDDLGRELRFQLRRDRADWETRPRLTSATLLAELTESLNPRSEKYDERLASNVLSVAAPSPFEVTVRFRRPPLKPEALFRMALTAAAEAPGLNPDLSVDLQLPGERFRMLTDGDQTVRGVRIRPEPAAIKQRHLAELVERQYETWDQLLQGLQRGEVSAVAKVEPIDLPALKGDPRYYVLPYAQPVSHLIQFHPRSVLTRNGQLRRALLHAIPRDRILQEQLLPGVRAPSEIARLSSSPITMATAEYNRLLPPPEYEPILSAGLAATARKELGGTLPQLKIAFPPEVDIRRVVEAMIVQWQRVGIEVVPIQSATQDWDLAYRTLQFREPIVELWPFFTMDPSSRVASLSVFPERVRRQLMALERATSWSGAIQVLHRFQADLLIDAWWIPLWEIDEFCLFRRNVTGLPESFVHSSQEAERWIVQSWYPTDAP